MHNGPPSQTSCTVSTIIVRFYPNNEVARPAFNETLSAWAEEQGTAASMRRQQRLQLEALLARAARPGRPQRAHFPELARGPERPANAPREPHVVPDPWNRAMRARWLR